MAITITDRPSKELSNGFLSKWSSSELPLQYELENDLYPKNQTGLTPTITDLVYNSAVLGVVVTTGSPHLLQVLDTVTIDGTGTELDGGNFSIKAKTTSTITLDFFTTESSSTGTVKKYFNNYKGLIKVFVGAPDQHPYNLDGSKPLIEAGIIEVDFVYNAVQDKNIGVVNINSYVKTDISPKFDENVNGILNENTHYGWGSYYIQYAESYDSSDGAEITTVQTAFADDVQQECEPFTDFLNSSFDDGLDDWQQECAVSSCDVWTAGAGFVNYSDADNSNVLFQEKTLYTGITYDLTVDFDVNVGSNRVVVLMYGFDGTTWRRLITDAGAPWPPLGNSVINYSVTPSRDYDKIGVSFASNSTTINIDLNSFNISTNVAQPCLFTQWANFGTKQFQDSLGANFGDYVLNVVDSITPKILTHFDEKTYFYDKPIYFSSIIPASTFSLSEENNSVFVSVELFDESGNVVASYNKRVTQKGEGVYTSDLDIKFFLDYFGLDACSWSTGTARYIIVPSNTFIDAINGTFEDVNTANWDLTMLTYSGGTPNQIGTVFTSSTEPRTGTFAGDIGWSAPSMNEVNKLYSIFENDNTFKRCRG